jgi:hypothetical protein
MTFLDQKFTSKNQFKRLKIKWVFNVKVFFYFLTKKFLLAGPALKFKYFVELNLKGLLVVLFKKVEFGDRFLKKCWYSINFFMNTFNVVFKIKVDWIFKKYLKNIEYSMFIILFVIDPTFRSFIFWRDSNA